MIYNKLEDALLCQKMMFDNMVEEAEIRPIVDTLLAKDEEYIRALAVDVDNNIDIMWWNLSPEGKGRLSATINDFITLMADGDGMDYVHQVYRGRTNPLTSLFGRLEVA